MSKIIKTWQERTELTRQKCGVPELADHLKLLEAECEISDLRAYIAELESRPAAPVVAEGLTDDQIESLWQNLPRIEIHNNATRKGMDTQYALRIAFARKLLAAHPVVVSQNDIEMVRGALDLCEPEDQAAFKRILNQIGVK